MKEQIKEGNIIRILLGNKDDDDNWKANGTYLDAVVINTIVESKNTISKKDTYYLEILPHNTNAVKRLSQGNITTTQGKNLLRSEPSYFKVAESLDKLPESHLEKFKTEVEVIKKVPVRIIEKVEVVKYKSIDTYYIKYRDPVKKASGWLADKLRDWLFHKGNREETVDRLIDKSEYEARKLLNS